MEPDENYPAGQIPLTPARDSFARARPLAFGMSHVTFPPYGLCTEGNCLLHASQPFSRGHRTLTRPPSAFAA